MMTKTEARAQAKALRKNLDLHAIGAAMTQQLFALPAWQQAGTVFCFVSMRDEPDTTAILQQALVSGKRLCVPRCLPGNDGRMELVEITSLNDLQPGRYGILEPCGGRRPAPSFCSARRHWSFPRCPRTNGMFPLPPVKY